LATCATSLTLLATSVASSAWAQTPAAPSAAPPAAVAGSVVPDGDRIVCRSVSQTGSRFPVRVCKTKAQLEQDRRQAAETFDKFIDRNRRNNVGSAEAYTRH
jgi:hypothetical protein